MLDLLKLKCKMGRQYVPDIKKAEIGDKFRGFPVISGKCRQGCSLCAACCPSQAISLAPLALDLGRCVFCGECAKACPDNSIVFSNKHKLAATDRNALLVKPGLSYEDYTARAVRARENIRKMFGRSLKLRQVSAGGCGACEAELAACSNVNFDMGRFGIEVAASPRHSDGLLITGPVSENMAYALLDTYRAAPAPKIVIAAGACAISGGIFREEGALNRDFFSLVKTDLFIPGCPVHPLTVINGILSFLGA